MAFESYFPFDSGNGANVTEYQWGKMAKYWLSSGVIPGWGNELKVYADSTGMKVKVPTGRAWVEGHFYEYDLTALDLMPPIATADATNPRIDRIVLRVDWVANIILVGVLQGVPAGSPTPPALTQITGTQWEIPLAQVRVDAGVATIAASKVTDERQWAGPITTPFDAKTLRSYVHAYPTAGTAFTTGTWVKITNGAKWLDNLYEYDVAQSRLTFKRGGLYLVQCAIWITGVAANVFKMMAYLNGASSMYMYDGLQSSAGDLHAIGHALVMVNAGDYLEVWGNLNGNATSAVQGSGTTFFKCVQVA